MLATSRNTGSANYLGIRLSNFRFCNSY